VDNSAVGEHTKLNASAVRATELPFGRFRQEANMKSRALVIAVSALLAHTTAHAWFFFFLPGSLFSGKGDTCVSAAAKVGDTINKSGSVVVVKALSGTSSRCTNPEMPVLAEVESKSVDSNTTQARINIPDGWVQQPVSDALKAGGVVLSAWNQTLDAGLQLATFKRPAMTSADEFVASRKASQLTRLRESQGTPTTRLSIDGLPAWRYEVSGRVPDGKIATYTITIVEGAHELVSVMAWTTAVAFKEGRGQQLTAIADTLAGLPGSRSFAAANTPEPAPVSSVSQATASPRPIAAGSESAQKLRELNGLFKEGLITQEEYEAKKVELLKQF
jgi:hypothetical protein